MMLAIYLAQPEVENDRRALNVTYGMRRAMKEGRYMGLAPVGYINKSAEDGRKYIALLDAEAAVLKWAFEEIARGVFNTEQIYNEAVIKGFKRAKSLFHFAIRNPVYCGKIFIPKFKDEEAKFVVGQHELLISEQLFDQVQDVLEGRSRQYQPKIVSDQKFPFHGFLICQSCGKMLTASTSKGRKSYYSYYHCGRPCKERLKAEVLDAAFYQEIEQYLPRKEAKRLYAMVISEVYHGETKSIQDEKRVVLKQIKDLEIKLSNSRDLVASGKIDSDDFRELKTTYSEEIGRLEKRLTMIHNENADIEGLLNEGIEHLLKLEKGADKADYEGLRRLTAAIFPENFTFDGTRVRTARINTILKYIYQINNKLDENKKGQVNTKFDLSCLVGMAGFEPTTSTSQMWRDTGLRYIPNFGIFFFQFRMCFTTSELGMQI